MLFPFGLSFWLSTTNLPTFANYCKLLPYFYGHMNLFLAIDKLLHRLGAKNRHGLHSPYIYKLLDEIVYDLGPKSAYTEPENLADILPPDHDRPNSQKVNRLLFRLVQYFHPDVLAIADNVNTITYQYIQQATQAMQVNWSDLATQPANLLICDAGHIAIPTQSIAPGTIIIATNIYADATARAFWQQLKANPNINVTADLFSLGLAFNRPEQADEHFKLRF
jgi:hypothetical protein